MRRRVFADTLYWIAITYPRDRYCDIAQRVSQELGEVRILTSELILGEYLTGLSSYGQHWRGLAVERVDAILRNPNIDVEPQSHEAFRAALDLCRSRPDKEYSFVDCDSMVLMRRENIQEVLTHDHHFEQEGFTILLKQPS